MQNNLQTSTDLSCLNPQTQAIIEMDDRTYNGINIILHSYCLFPRFIHTRISKTKSRRWRKRQMIMALNSTKLSPSPLKDIQIFMLKYKGHQ
jgi:hypothetical protein